MKNKLPYVMTKEELLKLFGVMNDLRMVMFTFIGIFFGLRAGEIVTLKWSDVDLIYGEMRIKDAKNTNRYKTGYGKDRIVPINNIFIPALKKWKFMNGNEEHVIPRYGNANRKTDYTIRVYQDNFHKFLARAGLNAVESHARNGHPRYKYHLHTLRHVCGTNLYRAGLDIYQIKEYLGHEDIETTKIYCELAKDDLKAAAHKAYVYPKSRVGLEQAEIIVSPDTEALKLQNENLKLMLQLKGGIYAQR